MHTFWVRLNAVVFFGFTVLLCLSLLTAFRYVSAFVLLLQRSQLHPPTHQPNHPHPIHSTYGHGDYGTVKQLNVNKLIQL